MLIDPHDRKISYLRLSITDVCNFKCQYCLPDGYHCDSPKQFLSLDEIRRVTTAFAELGVWKLRLTGGEPSVRKDFLEIASLVANIPGIEQVAVTTNGFRLFDQVEDWKKAGIKRLNVSVDSLQEDKFQKMTGVNKLDDILKGLKKAEALGFDQVKVNVVLHKGLNDNEYEDFLNWTKHSSICVSFIELMQTGENLEYFNRYHVSAAALRELLIKKGWHANQRKVAAGPAIIYNHTQHKGNIGIIAAYSKDFCKGCNRLRVTSTGDLRLCLFGDYGTALRDYLQNDTQKEELKDLILNCLGQKTESHFLKEGNPGMTPHLASIGG